MTGVAPSAWNGFRERVARLYEQNAPLEVIRRGVELYVRRWKRWVRSGVRYVIIRDAFKWPAESCERTAFASPPTTLTTLVLSA
jgi:hypothetical protein